MRAPSITRTARIEATTTAVVIALDCAPPETLLDA
jgi:hypothetical protein